jgi:uncharacterized membrane protein
MPTNSAFAAFRLGYAPDTYDVRRLLMASVQESIVVDVPVDMAYNQWTQFEEFPKFMEGVKSVRQLDDTHLQWTAEIGGEEHTWKAEITEQVPDHVIAWRAPDGKYNSGRVTFEPLPGGKTRADVELTWDAEGWKESVGSALGFDERQVKKDLERFKEFIESRGMETGAWRGEVQKGTVTSR